MSLSRFWILSILFSLALPLSGCSTTSTPAPEPKPRAFTDRSGIPKEPVDTGETFMIVDEMPQLIGGLASIQKHVLYPPSLVRASVEGRVFVQFVVDVEGIPGEIVVVRSPHYLMDQPAIDAVAKARFIPGSTDGVAVPVKMSLPITFQVSRSDC